MERRLFWFKVLVLLVVWTPLHNIPFMATLQERQLTIQAINYVVEEVGIDTESYYAKATKFIWKQQIIGSKAESSRNNLEAFTVPYVLIKTAEAMQLKFAEAEDIKAGKPVGTSYSENYQELNNDLMTYNVLLKRIGALPYYTEYMDKLISSLDMKVDTEDARKAYISIMEGLGKPLLERLESGVMNRIAWIYGRDILLFWLNIILADLLIAYANKRFTSLEIQSQYNMKG